MSITDSIRHRRAHVRPSALVLLAVLFGAPAVSSATTVEPITFDQMVQQADVIFVGEVVDVHPYTLQVRGRTIIHTRVTFGVADPIYGTKSLVEVFDFLGGEAGGIGMAVEGMPKFAVGDRRVVFAHRSPSINPIVGFTQGLLKVARDSGGVDRVVSAQGVALTRGNGSAASMMLAPRMIPDTSAMSLADFRGRIVASLAAANRQ